MALINKNTLPIIFIVGAVIAAISNLSRVEYNFPIFIFCFFAYTFDKVKSPKLRKSKIKISTEF